MSKSITIKPSPRDKQPPDARSLDAFVHGPTPGQASVAPIAKGPMKRLTFDIPADLHKRIRRTCLDKEVEMTVELRRILNEHFPA